MASANYAMTPARMIAPLLAALTASIGFCMPTATGQSSRARIELENRTLTNSDTVVIEGRGIELRGTITAEELIANYQILVDGRVWQGFRLAPPSREASIRAVVLFQRPGEYRVSVRAFDSEGSLLGETYLTVFRPALPPRLFSILVAVDSTPATAKRFVDATRAAEEVRRALLSRADGDAARTFGPASMTRTTDVSNVLRHLSLAIGSDDRLLFYFSGPVIRIRRAGGGDAEDRLVFADSRLEAPATSLSLYELARMIRVSGFRRAYVLLDTCAEPETSNLTADMKDFWILGARCEANGGDSTEGAFSRNIARRLAEGVDLNNPDQWVAGVASLALFTRVQDASPPQYDAANALPSCKFGSEQTVTACPLNPVATWDGPASQAQQCSFAVPPGWVLADYRVHVRSSNNGTYDVQPATSGAPQIVSLWDLRKAYNQLLQLAESQNAISTKQELFSQQREHEQALTAYSSKPDRLTVRARANRQGSILDRKRGWQEIVVEVKLRCLGGPSTESLVAALRIQYGL